MKTNVRMFECSIVRMFVLGFALLGVREAYALSGDVEIATEDMRWFSAEGARRYLKDMRAQKGYDFTRHNDAVENLIAHEDEVRGALGMGKGSDPNYVPPTNTTLSCEQALTLVKGWQAAVKANPILDFDHLLCVRRNVGASDARLWRECAHFGNYRFSQRVGLIGLNAHNHADMQISGFTNDICVISNFREKPQFNSLYTPPNRGIVRDLDLDFDASRVLFTSAHGTNGMLGVYEIDVPRGALNARSESAVPSESARLISPHDDADLSWWDGCYLPNRNQVILLGTGGWQFLPCEAGDWPMASVYRTDRKTGETRQLTFDQDSSYTPSITSDGRVIYTRWEYSDLVHYFSRELMTMNPDGVGQLALWGSGSASPTFFYCARAVPGSAHLLTMLCGGHHGRAELGRFYLVDPSLARSYPFRYDPPDREWGPPRHYLRIPAKTYPKEKTGLAQEFPGYGKDVPGDMADLFAANQFARKKPYFAYPWPLSENYHLATVRTSKNSLWKICVVDRFDNIVTLAQCEDTMLLEPIPLKARVRPPVIPDRSVSGKTTCSVHIADIYKGVGLEGVPRGTVKKLRIFSYHFCYHNTGGHNSVGLDLQESGWDVKQILGTVDVEEDGSACFEMPANTPISFQPLDADDSAVQLMRSWVTGMPGERVSCTGCHEDNRTSISTSNTIADRNYHAGKIQQIKPVDADGVRPWGFATEVWPVVKRRCIACHGNAQKAPLRGSDQGGISDEHPGALSGRRIVFDSAENTWRALHPYIRRPNSESEIMVLTPLDYHFSTSPLAQILAKGHHGVTLEKSEMRRLREWADLNAPFYGKWAPKPFTPDSFMTVACTNQVEKRKTLQRRFARLNVDPEAAFDRYAAIVSNRAVDVVMPKKCAPTPKSHVRVVGWPFDKVGAFERQMGAIHEDARPTVKTVVLGAGASMTFRLIPAGSFVMGSEAGYADEAPRRLVKIEKPFWMGEMEVQNAQYAVFDPAHDSKYQDMTESDIVMPGLIGNHRRMPVVRVSWEEACAFCTWLSKKLGETVSLPTEAQWEWAARAGTDTAFPWGSVCDDFSEYANLADRRVRATRWKHNGDNGRIWNLVDYPNILNYPLHEERWKDDWHTINFTARTLPNAWGLYDMHGNAAEWTLSAYGNPAYSGIRRVVRGGSFASRPRDATSSWRWGYAPWQKVYDVGFRVIIETH